MQISPEQLIEVIDRWCVTCEEHLTKVMKKDNNYYDEGYYNGRISAFKMVTNYIKNNMNFDPETED